MESRPLIVRWELWLHGGAAMALMAAAWMQSKWPSALVTTGGSTLGTLCVIDRQPTALTDDQLAFQYANCSAVYYGARAEDYGLVTLEAFSSGKPVITCTDSGGPAELVQDGETGFVIEPEADAPPPVAPPSAPPAAMVPA